MILTFTGQTYTSLAFLYMSIISIFDNLSRCIVCWSSTQLSFSQIFCVFNFRKYSKKKFFFLPFLLLHLNDRSKADSLRSLCPLLNTFDNAFTHPLRKLCYMSRRELYTLNFISYFIYLTFTLFTGSL